MAEMLEDAVAKGLSASDRLQVRFLPHLPPISTTLCKEYKPSPGPGLILFPSSMSETKILPTRVCASAGECQEEGGGRRGHGECQEAQVHVAFGRGGPFICPFRWAPGRGGGHLYLRFCPLPAAAAAYRMSPRLPSSVPLWMLMMGLGSDRCRRT